MSFIDQIAKIEKAKADIAAAEAKLALDRLEALAKLPSDYGYDDINAFLKAVKDAFGKGAGSTESRSGKGKSGKKLASSKAVKGKRAKITDEIKAEVRALAEAGKTGQEIASILGISAPSVQNIKKALGMVKARSVVPAVAGGVEVVAEVQPAE